MEMIADTITKSRRIVLNRLDMKSRDMGIGFEVISSNVILKMQEK